MNFPTFCELYIYIYFSLDKEIDKIEPTGETM